jgi:hypothetical protein
MKKKGKSRKCPFCHILFIPCGNNVHRQKYCCGTDECRKVSHRDSSRRYRESKRDDRKWKKEECERVKDWQKQHPDYWTRKKKRKIFLPTHSYVISSRHKK